MKRIKLLTCLTLALALIFGNSLTAFASEITDEETAVTSDKYYFGDAELDEDGVTYLYFIDNYTGCYASQGIYERYTVKSSSPLLLMREDVVGSRYGDYYIYNLYSGINEKSDSLINTSAYYEVIEHYYGKGSTYAEAKANMSLKTTTTNVSPMSVYYNLDEAFISTSLPVFEDEESAKAYVANGDDSGVINKKPVPEHDETFMFTDFDVNEYVSATWSGTTFDDRIAEFDAMGYKVVAGYCFVNGSPGQIMDTQVITESGLLSTKTWKKKQLTMAHEDVNMWLRYVSFTPYYEQYGQTCLGKSETIWLDPDGNTDLLPNDELTMIEDSNFYLKGVSVEESNLGIVDGDVRSYISWTGTTWDDKVSKVPLDSTYADILVLCYNSSSKPVYKDLYEIDADFMGGESLPLRRSSSDSTQAFYLNTTEIDNAVSALGLTFSGKVYITPYMYYEMDNAIYKGAPTIISIFSNNIESGGGIGDGSEINPTPVPSGSPSDIPSISDEEITLDNALGVLWDVLKSLWNGMGQLPSLLYQMFPFLPVELYQFLFIGLLVIIVLRILGR